MMWRPNAFDVLDRTPESIFQNTLRSGLACQPVIECKFQAFQAFVVYVGKANNLKARLSQYFAPNPGDTRFFVRLLEDVLGAIELGITRNGKEALIL